MIPTTQFAYWKDLGTCDTLLCMSHTLQSALESGQEARIVQIDFIAAFDRVCREFLFYSRTFVADKISDIKMSVIFSTQ